MTDQEFGPDYCSASVRNAKPSEVRKVFAMSARPGMISSVHPFGPSRTPNILTETSGCRVVLCS